MVPPRKWEEVFSAGIGMLERLKKMKATGAESAKIPEGSSSGSKEVSLRRSTEAGGIVGAPPQLGDLLILNESQVENCDVVTGVFPVYSLPTLVLFDSGASNSFISSKLVREFGISPSSSTTIKFKVASAEVKACEHIFERVPVEINGVTFLSDLIQFDLDGIGVVLGMDWLGRYKAQILCNEQKVVLRSLEGKRVSYKGVPDEPEVRLVSMIKIRKYLDKGHEVFLCAVEDLSAPKEEAQQLPVVREFPDVFP